MVPCRLHHYRKPLLSCCVLAAQLPDAHLAVQQLPREVAGQVPARPHVGVLVVNPQPADHQPQHRAVQVHRVGAAGCGARGSDGVGWGEVVMLTAAGEEEGTPRAEKVLQQCVGAGLDGDVGCTVSEPPAVRVRVLRQGVVQ